MRLDKFLVNSGICTTRTRAQELITSGGVNVNGKTTLKPSHDLGPDDKVVAAKIPQHKYVSRAGYKLEKAINHIGLDINGLLALDIGQSTGGFTDCLLQHGASKVIGLDVGVNQLHKQIRQNKNVLFFEKINAKNLEPFLKSNNYQNIFNLVVCDMSFISVTTVFPFLKMALTIHRASSKGALLLVKPQFELGAEALNSKGVVKDPGLYVPLKKNIINNLEQQGYKVLDYFSSQLEGKSGNKEFFVYVK